MSLSNAILNVFATAALTNNVGSFAPGIRKNITFASGVLANQVDLGWAASRTVTNAGTPDTIDFSGSLVQADGSSAVFVSLVALLIQNLSTDVLTVGADANALASMFGASTHTVKLKKKGILLLVAPDDDPYGVTAATGDILKVATAGTGSQYNIFALGRSA